MPGASMSGAAMPSAPGFPQQSGAGLPQPPRRGQQTMPAPELADIEDTETGKRKPNFILFGGIAAGVLLLIVVVAMFSGGDPKPDPVATNDTAAAVTTAGTPAAPTVGGLQIEVGGLPVDWAGKAIELFPETAGVLDNAAPRQSAWNGKVWTVTVPLSDQRFESPQRMDAVLVPAGSAVASRSFCGQAIIR